jgi:C_GCAxxG_C_C family probable redox protein
LAVAESQGIQSDLLPKIATGFCSGVARTGGQCGGLSGAIMGLGLLTGRSEPGEPVDEAYVRVQELVERFEEEFGSIHCQTLTGCHLGTEEGQAKFRESNQAEKCLTYVEEVTRMVLEMNPLPYEGDKLR